MTEAYRLSGRNPDYAIQLGELYLALDQLDPAKQMALEVLAANRNHAPAWALLGDTHRSQSDWPSALECYHHALLIRGDYPKVQYSVADIYRTIGRPERALSTLDHMVDLHSSVADDTQFMFLKGVALADLNRPKDALEILAKCSEKLPPDDWQKQLQIAETQARLSDLVAARMALGRIPSDRSGTPAVRKIRERLDSDFLQLANATNPSVAAGKDLPSGAIPSLYLAEPAKFPAIQR